MRISFDTNNTGTNIYTVIGVQQSTDGGSNWMNLFNQSVTAMILVRMTKNVSQPRLRQHGYITNSKLFICRMYVNTTYNTTNELKFRMYAWNYLVKMRNSI